MKNLNILIALVVALSVSACSSSYKSQSSNYDDIYYTPVDEEFATTEKVEQPRYDSRDDNRGNQDNSRFGYDRQADQVQSERYTSDDGATNVTNNYYYNNDDYYDYAYSARVRRFHNPVGLGYYNNYYTNSYWYDYNPYSYGTSIYLGYNWWRPRWNIGWNSWTGWNIGIGYGYGYGGYGGACYDPWGWNQGWGWYNPSPWYGSYWSGYNQGYWNGYWNGYYANAYNPYYFNSYDYSSYHYGPRANLASNNKGGGGRTLSQLHETSEYGNFASNDVHFGSSLDAGVSNTSTPKNPYSAESGFTGKDKNVLPGKSNASDVAGSSGDTPKNNQTVAQPNLGKSPAGSTEPVKGSAGEVNPANQTTFDTNTGKNPVLGGETPKTIQTRPKGYDAVGTQNQGSFSTPGKTGVPKSYEGAGDTRPKSFESTSPTYDKTPRNYQTPKSYESTPRSNDTPKNYQSTPRSYESAPRNYQSTPRSYESTPRSNENTPRSYESTPRSYDGAPRGYESTPRSYESTPKPYNTNPRTGEYNHEPRQNNKTEYYKPRQSAPSKSYEKKSNDRGGSSAPSYNKPSGNSRSYSAPKSSGSSKSRSSGGNSSPQRKR